MSKIIISKLESVPKDKMEMDGYVGYVNVGKWTKKEGGVFSIWESKKPIYEILESETLYNFMLGNRIEIEKEIFDENFFDNTFSK